MGCTVCVSAVYDSLGMCRSELLRNIRADMPALCVPVSSADEYSSISGGQLPEIDHNTPFFAFLTH